MITQGKVLHHLSMAHASHSLFSGQFIHRQHLELFEATSDEKSCEQWMALYKNRANETKKDIQAMHEPCTMQIDLHEAAKKDIRQGIIQRKQEEKKFDRDEEMIMGINGGLHQARLKMKAHATLLGSMRRMREQKQHEMKAYWKRYYHWNLVKNGWSWNDESKFGRFYYIRQEELQCVKNASAEETARSISDKVWKIRKDLNVQLVKGLTDLIFV